MQKVELNNKSSINIIKTVRIKTKDHGDIYIYVIQGNEQYPTSALLMMANNNPNYYKYNSKENVFYLNYYSLINLTYNLSSKFYESFLIAGKNNKTFEYLDASKKYLNAYAKLQNKKDK